MLTPVDCVAFGLPAGCQWEWSQDQIFKGDPSTVARQFNVAWDKDNTAGKKIYGAYPDASAFFRNLKPSGNHGYELIHVNAQCALFLDIEWYGDNDIKHLKMQWIAEKLRTACENRFGMDPGIYVALSSRQTNEGFKNSYHVVCPAIRFDTNHDGTMEQFITAMCEGDGWYNQGKSIVDLTVYGKNRCMRLPFNCKRGSSTSFVRISGDPLVDDFSKCFNDPADPESWSPFIITGPPPAGYILAPQAPFEPQVRKRKQVAKTGTSTPAPRQDPGETLPFPLVFLQELLHMSGELTNLIARGVKRSLSARVSRACTHAPSNLHFGITKLIFLFCLVVRGSALPNQMTPSHVQPRQYTNL